MSATQSCGVSNKARSQSIAVTGGVHVAECVGTWHVRYAELQSPQQSRPSPHWSSCPQRVVAGPKNCRICRYGAGFRVRNESMPPPRWEVHVVECVGTCSVCNVEWRSPQCVTAVLRNRVGPSCTPGSPRCGVRRYQRCPQYRVAVCAMRPKYLPRCQRVFIVECVGACSVCNVEPRSPQRGRATLCHYACGVRVVECVGACSVCNAELRGTQGVTVLSAMSPCLLPAGKSTVWSV